MPNNIKIITIIGDCLSSVSPASKIFYEDTYPFKLQELLGREKYHIILKSNSGNKIIAQALRINLDENILYNNSKYIIFHLGVVDCAPRLFGLTEDRIISVLNQKPVLKVFIELLIKFKSKYRRFFTKYFPKTYVSRKDFREKYAYVIEEIRKKAKPRKIFLINIADTNKKNKFRSFNFEKNILDYNKIIEEIAFENKDICELVDFFSVIKQRQELLSEDGIHLTKDGQICLARILNEKIKKEENKND